MDKRTFCKESKTCLGLIIPISQKPAPTPICKHLDKKKIFGDAQISKTSLYPSMSMFIVQFFKHKVFHTYKYNETKT
jgi:hypothetical protein